jgi:threonine dehydrogenase-like Zn-dependent dehydrogenase
MAILFFVKGSCACWMVSLFNFLEVVMPQRLKTRAIIFSRPVRAEVRDDLILPEMDDEGILVHTKYSTISRGTELDLYSGQMHGKGVNAQWYPMLPGYMPVGTVEAIGKKVDHVKIGDRYVRIQKVKEK